MILKRSSVDHHHGGLSLRVESRLQLVDQRSAVGQARQFIVVRVEARALLGVDSALELYEHGGDRLESIDLRRVPIVQVEVKEAEHPPR